MRWHVCFLWELSADVDKEHVNKAQMVQVSGSGRPSGAHSERQAHLYQQSVIGR